jgi:hypothetical protein
MNGGAILHFPIRLNAAVLHYRGAGASLVPSLEHLVCIVIRLYRLHENGCKVVNYVLSCVYIIANSILVDRRTASGCEPQPYTETLCRN